MAKKKKAKRKHCWALASWRQRKPGEGVGESAGVPVAFWNGSRWVKDPVFLACGGKRVGDKLLDATDTKAKGSSAVSAILDENIVKLPKGRYDFVERISEGADFPRRLRGR